MHIVVTDSFDNLIACVSVDELENDTDILMRGVNVYRVFTEPILTDIGGKVKFIEANQP